LKRLLSLIVTGILAGGCGKIAHQLNSYTPGAGLTAAPARLASQSSPLLMSPASASVAMNRDVQYQVSGGVPPYQLSASAGTLVSAGIYRAPAARTTATVTARDAAGQTATLTVQVLNVSTLFPSDTYFSLMPGLHQASDADIDAPEAWGIQSDCRATPVAVIDTGIDLTHPDLGASLWSNPREIPGNGVDDDGNGYADDVRGWNFVDGNASPQDDMFHGTHVAGTIGAAGNNSQGVTGICWRARLVALKVLDGDGSGFQSDTVQALHYARLAGIRVVNYSAGSNDFSQSFSDAVAQSVSAGMLVAAAAGNDAEDNDSTAEYPANYPGVISVAATDDQDQLAGFSNYGATSVDIAAPGQEIASTYPVVPTQAMEDYGIPEEYGTSDGTSMATPHVAGALALIWSVRPELSAAQVRDALLSGADTRGALSGKVAGSRRLNLRRALEAGYPR
jgi:subtilisin family serine protease